MLKIGKFNTFSQIVIFVVFYLLVEIVIQAEIFKYFDDEFLSKKLSWIIAAPFFIVLFYAVSKWNGEYFGVPYLLRKKIKMEIISPLLILGVIFFFMTIGLLATQVYLISKVSPDYAFKLWDFSPQEKLWGINDQLGYKAGLIRVMLFVSVQCLTQPFIEELFFRAIIFRRIAEKKGLITGAIISSILFSLLHGENHFLSTFVLGISFCYFFHRYKNIYFNVLLHGLINFFLWIYNGFGGIKYFTNKSMGDIGNIDGWALEFSFLFLSIVLLVLYLYRSQVAIISKRQYKNYRKL